MALQDASFILVALDPADAPNARQIGFLPGIELVDHGAGDFLSIGPSGELGAIQGLESGQVGLAVRTTPGNWSTVFLTSNAQTLNITNPGGIAGNINLDLRAQSSIQNVLVQYGGTLVTPMAGRAIINFEAVVAGSVTITDDGTNNRVNVTITQTGTVSSISATSSTPDITITGSPITTAGTLSFGLAQDLAGISALGGSGTGLVHRTGDYTYNLISPIASILGDTPSFLTATTLDSALHAITLGSADSPAFNGLDLPTPSTFTCASNQAMTFVQQGSNTRVGLGTTTPGSRLHVVGGIQQRGITTTGTYPNSDRFFAQTGNTTINTATASLAQITVSPGSMVSFNGQINGIASDQSAGIAVNFSGAARYPTSGTLTFIGVPSLDQISDFTTDPTVTVTIDTGSNSLFVQVTGIGATTIIWLASFSYFATSTAS
jgi:hypothetical protein